MVVVQYANLALRFLLELCALVSLGYWGFQVGKGWLIKSLLGIGAPLLIAVIWGTFIAPKASIAVPSWLHLTLELTVFGLSIAALYAAGRPTLAILFGILVGINRILMYIWEQ